MTTQTPPLSRLCESAQAHVASAIHEIERVEASNQEVVVFADDAATVSSSGLELAETTHATFDELRNSSEEINDVIKLIDNVADQTHLLALNATIEAARAGDAGRGFAVVAAEVKNLASQTAGATQQVGQRIAAIQASAQKAIDAMESIVQVVSRIGELQSSIAAEIQSQDGMTQAMQNQVNEVSCKIEEIAMQIGCETAAL